MGEGMGTRVKPARFIGGDPLRALAALSVLVYHATVGVVLPFDASVDLNKHFGVVGDVVQGFDLGIYIFFVLSGYLVGRPFIAALRDGRTVPSLGRYFRNRLLRIVPAFWFAAALTLILLGARARPMGRSWPCSASPRPTRPAGSATRSRRPGRSASSWPSIWRCRCWRW